MLSLYVIYSFPLSFLYTRWIQHHPHLSSNGLRRQISSESASDDTVGTMSSADLAPVDSEFVSIFIGTLCLGNKGHSLAEVKVHIIFGVDTLDFDQTDIVVLVAETALVTKDGTVYVKAWGSWRHFVILCISVVDGEEGAARCETRLYSVASSDAVTSHTVA